MRLTALVHSHEHVCCRYRLAAFRPYFERAGLELELRPLPRYWWGRLGLLMQLPRADLVILQRKLLRTWQFHLLRRAARILVFDFDDAIFLRDSYSSKGPYSRQRRRRFKAIVRGADAVVAGNGFLREQALSFDCKGLVQVIPTCIDPQPYMRANHTLAGRGVQLVWIGSSSTLRGLEAIAPWMEQIGQRCPGLELKLISDRFLKLRSLTVRPCPWTESDEATELAAADIGISWLPEDAWSRGKCGLKVLQYMAAGLPIVANPIGVQAKMVRHGENGYLAETPCQWLEAIERLAGDPSLRQRMGEAGRLRVEKEFSVAAGAARWLAFLDELGRRRSVA